MTQANTRRPAGMFGFTLVWLGQIISVLATNMTHFGLAIWVYERAGEAPATAMGLQQTFFITPFLLISPLAGAMIDRYNRKLMMMLSDLGAGAATVAVLLLQAAGLLEVWHLWVAAAVTGTFQAFQWPAYSASISLMVSKEQYGRANGLMSLVEMGPGVLSPLLAGALLPLIGLTGLMLIDVVTFVLAVGILLFVFVPQPPRTEAGQQAARGGLLKESVFGFRYILARPSLLGLQLVFFFGNLFSGLGFTLLAPMLLARTDSNAAVLGQVQSLGAVGGIVGGVAMSTWGGFKRQVHGVLLGWLISSLAGQVLFGLGRDVPVWLAASFMGSFFFPIINGSNQAIWQAKVAPDVQGRVFAARRLIAWMTNPVTPVIAGVLADFAVGPAMQPGGALAPVFGPLVGTGAGAGMALILVFTGLSAALAGVLGYLFPAVRNAESLLPDHDAAPAGAAPASAGAAAQPALAD